MDTQMTTIEVDQRTAQLIHSLMEKAETQGITLEALLRPLTKHGAPEPKAEMTPEQKAQAWEEGVMSHDRNAPVIPDDSPEALAEEASVPVTIELSDEVLKDPSGDLSREILEQVALEGYKQERFSSAQVGRILGFTTPMQVDEFLKKHGVFFEYTEADFRMDEEASRWFQQHTR